VNGSLWYLSNGLHTDTAGCRLGSARGQWPAVAMARPPERRQGRELMQAAVRGAPHAPPACSTRVGCAASKLAAAAGCRHAQRVAETSGKAKSSTCGVMGCGLEHPWRARIRAEERT